MKYIFIYSNLIITTIIWFLLSILKTLWNWIWHLKFGIHQYVWKYEVEHYSGETYKVLYEYLTPYNKFYDIKTEKYKDKILRLPDFDDDYF